MMRRMTIPRNDFMWAPLSLGMRGDLARMDHETGRAAPQQAGRMSTPSQQ